MRCEELRDLLDLHLDGELPEETARRMNRHLLRCPACAYELHSLQQTRALLREAVPPTETTPGFRERAAVRLHNALAPQLRTGTSNVNIRQWSLPFSREE